MAPSNDSPEVQELLLSREARGLRVPLIARLILIGFAIASVTVLLVTGEEAAAASFLTFLVFTTLTSALVLNVYLFVLLGRGRHVESVGLVGAIFDALFVIALSSLAQLAGAGDGLGAAFVFKTEMPITVLAFVVINGLALRPRYPIIVGCGAVVALLVPACRMVLDPLTHYSEERAEIFGSTATDAAQVVTTVVMVVGSAVAVSLAAHAARMTIRRGIAQEVENARLQHEQLRVVMREKMTALGRLVAGVSHEINSPIGVLRSSIDTQRRIVERLSSPRDAEGTTRLLELAHRSLGAMHEASTRIASVEASLRALSHLDAAELQKVELHRELGSVLAAARRAHGTSTGIELEYTPVPEVFLNAAEFNQAMLAVVGHAFEAAGDEGTVCIRTTERDQSAWIEVSDNGSGMMGEQIAALFDVSLGGRGNRVAADLGLATAQSIIQRHGGEISVASEIGKGSTFTIRIPLGEPA